MGKAKEEVIHDLQDEKQLEMPMATEIAVKVEAQAVEHKTVHGEPLWYICLKRGNNTHYVSVGEKTYNKLKEMEAL